MEPYKKFIIGFFIVTVIILIKSYAIELSPGECIDIGNSTFSIQYCAPKPCMMNLTLSQNSTYFNSTGACLVNITTTPMDICSINEILGLNNTLNKTTGACNVTIKTPEYTCPACSAQQKCSINQRITPEENKSVEWGQYDNYCSVNVTTEPVPICPTYRLLQNQSIVDFQTLRTLSDAAAYCGTYAGQASILTSEKEQYKFQSETLKSKLDAVCNLNDSVLRDGWKQLSGAGQDNLLAFSSQKRTVYFTDFSDYMNPARLTTEQRNQVDLTATNLLSDYRRVNFAEDICDTNTIQGRNVTVCGYRPIVNPSCIDRAKYLVSIEQEASKSGGNTTARNFIIGISALYGLLAVKTALGTIPRI